MEWAGLICDWGFSIGSIAVPLPYHRHASGGEIAARVWSTIIEIDIMDLSPYMTRVYLVELENITGPPTTRVHSEQTTGRNDKARKHASNAIASQGRAKRDEEGHGKHFCIHMHVNER